MKPTSSLSLVSSLLALVAPATAVEYTVTSCAELVDVDDTVVTGLIIDTSTFSCDEYTRFRVRNTMTLKASVPTVEFSNFSLKVLGELTVEPNVVFSGVVEQVKNGGVLSVAEGASATFMGTSEFSDNSIAIKQLGSVPAENGGFTVGKGISYVTTKGGAVHNKGMLTFEGDAAFLRNAVRTEDSVEQGKAGAVSNTGSGTIYFKGKLTMEGNEAEGFFSGLGGGVYNRGEIVVDGESLFTLNEASNGGGIYQEPIGTFTFNGLATFVDNTAIDFRGGAVFNAGVMDFNAGSVFEENAADGSGDGGDGGGIYNEDGGVVSLMGSTTFTGNRAYRGGAIYSSSGDEDAGMPAAITTYPAGTVFVDNIADICPDVNDGENNCV